jgi:glutamine cyclotransferase
VRLRRERGSASGADPGDSLAGALRIALIAIVSSAVLAAPPPAAAAATPAPTVPWRLLDERPHDPTAYTQGLVAHDGVLLESTGLYGRSSVRRVDPRTGRVLRHVDLDRRLYGEGLTVLGGRAHQLTWLEGRILAWDPTTLAARGSRPYRFEGWGLTHDRRRLIASEGSSLLRWLDPATLRVVRTVRVTDGGRDVQGLNELELRAGILWANVYGSDRIALIDPRNGRVRGWVDLSRLRGLVGDGAEVLNGIARDPVTGHMAVTGKLWDRLFAIRLAGPVPAG